MINMNLEVRLIKHTEKGSNGKVCYDLIKNVCVIKPTTDKTAKISKEEYIYLKYSFSTHKLFTICVYSVQNCALKQHNLLISSEILFRTGICNR